MPSLEALEVLAVSDRPVFESVMQEIGLHVEGRVDNDPLRQQAQSESIVSIASELTEDIHTYVGNDRGLQNAKKMAEDYGYIVSYA